MYKWEKVLWMKKHPNFNRIPVRNIALENMLKKLKEVDSDADQEKVGHLIQSLRSEFFSELKKVKNNAGYKPKYIFFENLTFIADKEDQKFVKVALRNIKKNKVIEDDDPTVDALVAEAVKKVSVKNIRKDDVPSLEELVAEAAEKDKNLFNAFKSTETTLKRITNKRGLY